MFSDIWSSAADYEVQNNRRSDTEGERHGVWARGGRDDKRSGQSDNIVEQNQSRNRVVSIS